MGWTRAKKGGWQAAAIGLLMVIGQDAFGASADTLPRLVTETGFHQGAVLDVTTDNACALAATLGADRAVRLWNPANGQRLRTIRQVDETGAHPAGAVALTPDGKRIAMATAQPNGEPGGIVIMDATTDNVLARLDTGTRQIGSLAFATDGTRLLAGDAAGDGFTLHDTATWTEIARHPNHAGPRAITAFLSDGRIVQTPQNGTVRLFDRRLEIVAETPLRGGKAAHRIAIRRQGNIIAVGLADHGSIDLFLPRDQELDYLGSLSPRGIGAGEIGAVAWSQDGRRLLASGTPAKAEAPESIWRSFDFADALRESAPLPLSPHSALALTPCGEHVLAITDDPALGLVRIDGQKLWWIESPLAAREGAASDLMISPDGRRIRLRMGASNAAALELDTGRATLRAAPSPDDFVGPDVTTLNLAVARNGRALRLDGKDLLTIATSAGAFRAVAAHPSGEAFVVGTDTIIARYTKAGDMVWWQPAPGAPARAIVAADGENVVVLHGDGVVRWYRWSDGATRLSALILRDGRWIAWTPSGHYATAPGAESLLGWQVAGGMVPVSALRLSHYRPDVIARSLADEPATETPAPPADLAAMRPNQARSTSPDARARAPDKLVALVVGVSGTQQPDQNLAQAATDAAMVAQALSTRASQAGLPLSLRLLTDKDATATTIREGLAWLQAEAGPDELALVYLAGRATSDDRNAYRLLPDEGDAARLGDKAFARETLRAALAPLAGRAVVLLDICAANPQGQADMTLIANDLSDVAAGLIVLAACTGRETTDTASTKSPFAQALVETLSQGRGLTASSLAAMVSRRVQDLTQGRQNPAFVRPAGVPDITITGR
jgi:hypothetical protein